MPMSARVGPSGSDLAVPLTSDHFSTGATNDCTMEVAMRRQGYLGLMCAAMMFVAVPVAQAAAQDAAEAAAAAKASPALVSELSKELASTPEQAAGAAGALFGLAKTRLKPEEFSQVSKAVPGMG